MFSIRAKLRIAEIKHKLAGFHLLRQKIKLYGQTRQFNFYDLFIWELASHGYLK